MRRPGIEVSPGLLAHHEQAHRRALRRLFAARMSQAELHGFHKGRAVQGDMGPRPDRQPRRPPGILQDSEVTDLAGQEDVVPAADRADRHAHLGHPVPMVDTSPARLIGGVAEDVLDVVDAVPDCSHIRLAKRKRPEGPTHPAGPGELPRHRPAAFLSVDHDPPSERRLQ